MSIELPGWVVDAFYFVGLPWPGVDEDQLRGWGSDLREFAEEITAISGLSNSAVGELAHTHQSAFLATIAGNWEHHHDTIMAMREPMRAFADALDVAAYAVEVQKGAVITAAGVLAGAVLATQGEALVTFGLAEAEVPLEVSAAKLAIKFALQELENALLGELINKAADEVSTHISGTVAKLLVGGVGVVGETYALKTDTKAIRGLAGTLRTHARHTEEISGEAHRRTANRKLETDSPGGKWHVVEVLEAALLSIAGDLFRKLPGTLFQVMEKSEEDLAAAADRLDQVDADLAADAPKEEAAPVPTAGGGNGRPPTETPRTGGTGDDGENPDGNGDGKPTGKRPRKPKMPPKDTPEGKEARWERYQQRVAAGKVTSPLGYEAWSKKYDVAIYQHERADAKVDDYINRSGRTVANGWQKELPIGVGDKTRRMDIANPDLMEGIEYKSGAVPNDDKTAAEIKHDQILIAQGWNITWVFKVPPAPWLREQLKEKGIPWSMDDGGTTAGQ